MSIRNDFIQYLRGYAALMVVLDHTMLRLAHAQPDLAWLGNFAGDLGSMGVQIFFVISGYIMVAIAHDDFARPGASSRFWLARIKRIAPLYYLATLLVLILPTAIGGRSFGLDSIVSSLFFIASDARPNEGSLHPVLGVGWTLNYEMFFYLIFGLGLLMRRGIGLAFSIGSICMLVVAGKLLGHHGDLPHRSLAYFYTNHIMGLFAVGMVIALWQRSRYFRQIAIPFPAGIGATMAIAAILWLNIRMPGAYPLWRTLLAYTLASVPLALCVAALPRKPQPLLELIGNASFSIYLFHGFALSATILFWETTFGTALPVVRILLCVAVGTSVGIAAFLFLERPIVRLLKPRSRQAAQS